MPFGGAAICGSGRCCPARRRAGHAPARRLAEAHVPQEALGLPDHVQRRNDGGETPADGRGRREGASRVEALTGTDLRHIVDPEDVAATHALAARLARVMRARLVRREQIRRRGRRLDLRRTIHRNVSHGGTLIELAWRRRKIKPLRLVVLLDASGSMSLYTAFFVRFLHGVVDAFREAEAFVFHTRLAHVSPSLRDRNVTRAVEKLSLMAQGIGGGTRIGDSLAAFNRWHARRVINSRTAVMIVSDGYDTGEPGQLAAEMRRLRRRSKKIIWLNPLIGWRDYSPQARGMQAALPYVDLFAPAHNLRKPCGAGAVSGEALISATEHRRFRPHRMNFLQSGLRARPPARHGGSRRAFRGSRRSPGRPECPSPTSAASESCRLASTVSGTASVAPS